MKGFSAPQANSNSNTELVTACSKPNTINKSHNANMLTFIFNMTLLRKRSARMSHLSALLLMSYSHRHIFSHTQKWIPFYPAFVVRDVLGVEQLGGGRVFTQPVFGGGARVHEGLSHHRQAGIRDAALMNVKDKLRVLDHVHPEAQGKAGNCTGKKDVVWNGFCLDEISSDTAYFQILNIFMVHSDFLPQKHAC